MSEMQGRKAPLGPGRERVCVRLTLRFQLQGRNPESSPLCRAQPLPPPLDLSSDSQSRGCRTAAHSTEPPGTEPFCSFPPNVQVSHPSGGHPSPDTELVSQGCWGLHRQEGRGRGDSATQRARAVQAADPGSTPSTLGGPQAHRGSLPNTARTPEHSECGPQTTKTTRPTSICTNSPKDLSSRVHFGRRKWGRKKKSPPKLKWGFQGDLLSGRHLGKTEC